MNDNSTSPHLSTVYRVADCQAQSRPDKSCDTPGQTGKRPVEPFPVLSREEEITLLRAINWGTDEGFTEEEAETVFQWAIKTRINNCFLKLTLEGQVGIRFRPNGEPAFVSKRVCKGTTVPEKQEEVPGRPPTA